MDEQWSRLWRGIRELEARYEGRLVFIGGVAVYLHAVNNGLSNGFIERSHDGDFYISFSDYGDLRDAESVTVNRRLDKRQIVKHGVEFDVYLEHQSSLLVKYDDIATQSELIDDVRVACLEHLLVLKLDAYRDRRASQRGHKDERDLIRIVCLLGRRAIKYARFSDYLSDELLGLLLTIQRSDEFKTLSEGNLRRARTIREEVSATAAGLVRRARKS